MMILALGVVVAHGPHGSFKVCCSLLLNLVGQVVDLESVEPGHKLIGWTLWPVFWMHHEEHVWESGAEICAIRVMMPRRFWCVNVHAFGAVEFDHGLSGNVA